MRNHNKFNLGMNSDLHFLILLLWFHEIFCLLLAIIFRPKRLTFLEDTILHVLKVFQILNYLKLRYSEKAAKIWKKCFDITMKFQKRWEFFSNFVASHNYLNVTWTGCESSFNMILWNLYYNHWLINQINHIRQFFVNYVLQIRIRCLMAEHKALFRFVFSNYK